MMSKYKNLLKYIAETDASCANDIVYSLELVRTSLDTTMKRVKKEISLATENNSFDNVAQIADYCKQIKEIDDILLSVLPYLHTEEVSISKPVDQPATEIPNVQVGVTPSIKVNYSDYDVNRYEAHSLYEDFEYKRLYAIKIGEEKIIASSWNKAVILICEYLYKLDDQLMKSFVNNPKFQGKKIHNFSYDVVRDLDGRPRNKLIPGTKLYVWTNHNANVHVDNIKKILSEYNIPLDDVVVYLRRDLSELHR